jgi:alkyldihydroxyacetonephosphate synthase
MRRNRWGWGWEEKAIPLDELAPRAALLVDEVVPEASVPDSGLSLPAPRVAVPPAMAAFTTADPLVRACHTFGKAYPDRVRGFRGDYAGAPDLVASPGNEVDIERVFEVAAREQLAVIPFGGGSSVVGGVEVELGPTQRAAISLDLGRLSGVSEVDDVSLLARIQGGTLGPAIEQQLATRGLTLRHFPQSFELSSLGGWIATRAGGHFATVYTHIDDLVAGVRLLTPRGPFETRLVPASGAGPDPKRLVCGSEGILGVITEAWMRVRRRPDHRASASVRFAQFENGVAATRAIAQSGLFPSNCRLLDANEAMLQGVATDGSAVLVLGFESTDESVRALIAQALTITASFGGVCRKGAIVREGDEARGEDDSSAWREAFLKGPYLQDGLIRLGVVADTFETACTWAAFPALYETVVGATTKALESVCGNGAVMCRFTHVYPDGPAPYFTFVGKAKRGGELEQWAAIKEAATDAVLRAGGTVTHHHAVGRVHRKGYERERPALFGEVLRAAKRELDPAGMLNPGVLLAV